MNGGHSGDNKAFRAKRDHAPGKLSAIAISRIKKPGRFADGGGLLLVAKPRTGGGLSMYWSVRFQIEGRRREMSLGAYPAVSVSKARADAADVVAKARGQYDPAIGQRVRVDPLAIKRDVIRERKHIEALASWTFSVVAREVHAMLAPGWKNAKHAAQWISTLETYVFPFIGDTPVGEIEVADILSIITPIWTEKAETALRVLQRIDRCMRWAVAHRYAASNPVGPATELLPKLKLDREHHAAVTTAGAASAYERIAGVEGVSARALQFLILTAARSGEVRGATWAEIDLAARVWRVPAERMKGGRPHTVPLSEEAVALLQSVPAREPGEFVFAGSKPGRALSDMSLTATMRRLELGAVPHGWRSTFRDWCAESHVPREVAERALAHAVKDATEAAYNRTDLIEQRRPVMQRWARFVTGKAGAEKVVSIGDRAA